MKVYHTSGIYDVLEGKKLPEKIYGKRFENEAEYVEAKTEEVKRQVLLAGFYTEQENDQGLFDDIIKEALAEREKLPSVATPKLRQEIAAAFDALPFEIQSEFESAIGYSNINQHLDDGRFEFVGKFMAEKVAGLSEEAQKRFKADFAPLFEKLA